MTSELGEGSLFFSIDKLHAAVEAFSTSHLVVN